MRGLVGLVLAASCAALCVSCSDSSPQAPTANRPPTIQAVTLAPRQLEIGATGRISVAATDPDGDALQLQVTAQQGSVSPVPGRPMEVEYLARKGGVDLVTIRVLDPQAAEAVRHEHMTVAEEPAPRISYSPPVVRGTIRVRLGDLIRIDGCGAELLSFRVSWGDGARSQGGCRASHAYGAYGTYRLTLDAESPDGAAEAGAKGTVREEFWVVATAAATIQHVSPGGGAFVLAMLAAGMAASRRLHARPLAGRA